MRLKYGELRKRKTFHQTPLIAEVKSAALCAPMTTTRTRRRFMNTSVFRMPLALNL